MARPTKFNAGFSQPFLNVYTPSSLGSLRFGSPSPLGVGFFFWARVFIFFSVTVVIQSTSQLFVSGPIFPPWQGFQLFYFSSRTFAFAFAFAFVFAFTPRTFS